MQWRPGEVVLVTITLYPTSNIFEKGHRIRLDISSSNFPRFDVNPNNGESHAGICGGVVAHNRVYCEEQFPSRVVLPIIPL